MQTNLHLPPTRSPGPQKEASGEVLDASKSFPLGYFWRRGICETLSGFRVLDLLPAHSFPDFLSTKLLSKREFFSVLRSQDAQG